MKNIFCFLLFVQFDFIDSCFVFVSFFIHDFPLEHDAQ